MRYFVWMLALALLGFRAPRAEAQTTAQVLSFSIVCQYSTNFLSTNILANHTQIENADKVITTVLVDTPNMVKALSIDRFGTNWVRWIGSQLWYEVDLTTGTPYIFMRLGDMQVDVSTNFNNAAGVGTYLNMFSVEPGSVQIGGIDAFATNAAYGTNFASLPLIGGFETNYPAAEPSPFATVFSLTNFSTFDNLAYLDFVTTNLSFTLFGYSQGTLFHPIESVRGTRYEQTVDDAFISGAGTFSLNLTTNFLRVSSSNTYGMNIATNVVLATNFTGLAHGTVYVQRPFFINTNLSEPAEATVKP